MSALNAEEQKLFEEMSKDGGAQTKEAADKAAKDAADKSAVDKAAADKAAADKAAAEKKEEPKVVPLQALHEAREQNKDLRKEMEAMKAALADGDNKLKAALAKIEAKADAGPKFEDDPAAHLKHENAELKKGLAELQDKITKQETSAEHDGKMRAHANLVASKEQAFAKQNPDYFKASEHVAQLWREEFAEAGFDEAEIPKLVFAKALGITSKAVDAGRDPAEAIYKIAKKYGFAAPQKEEKGAKKEDGESKLKQIEKGLEAAKGTGGGSGPDADAGLTGLAELDDAELEKRISDPEWWGKNIRGRSPLH